MKNETIHIINQASAVSITPTAKPFFFGVLTSGRTKKYCELSCDFPAGFFPALLFIFPTSLQMILVFYRIGQLLMGEAMLRVGEAVSLCAVTQCHIHQPQKKTGGEREACKLRDTFLLP